MSGKIKEAISVFIVLSLIALIQLCEKEDAYNQTQCNGTLEASYSPGP